MPDCILHYGLPKTGSTAIQYALAKGLRDPRFHYGRFHAPPNDAGNHGRALAVMFSDRAASFHANLADGLGDAELAPLRRRLHASFDDEIARLDGATLVLHAESLEFLASTELERLRDHFRSRDVRTRPVGYVRPFRDGAESLFVQSVKSGIGKPALHRLGQRCRRERLFIGDLDSLFGRERVELWHYDRRAFPGGCVVADFCNRVGIASPPSGGASVNPGLSLDAVRLLYAYRSLRSDGVPDWTTNATLLDALGDLGGRRFRFHPSLLRSAMHEQGPHLDWLEARCGASLREGMDDDEGPSIRVEEDLLDFSPEALDWLARRTGIAASGLDGKDPRAVADAVGRLQEIARAERVAARWSPARLLADLGRRGRALFTRRGRRSP